MVQIKVAGAGLLTIGGKQGWCALSHSELPDVRIRLADLESSRFVVVALTAGSVADTRAPAVRLTGEMLRRLPLGLIERGVNDPGTAPRVRAAVADGTGPDLRPTRPLVTAPMPSEPPDSRLFDVPTVSDRLRFDAPDGPKDDAFYAAVLAAFEWASGWSRRPAVEIAKANDKPTTTVHRWIREAKRRAENPRLPL